MFYISHIKRIQYQILLIRNTEKIGFLKAISSNKSKFYKNKNDIMNRMHLRFVLLFLNNIFCMDILMYRELTLHFVIFSFQRKLFRKYN